jgi:ubiquinone/menaquinone biosynthesis C-methylase UbiE
MYWKLEQIIAPGLRYSQDSYEDVICGLVDSSTVWLDIGCGHQVLPQWRLDIESDLVSRASYVAGIDADTASLAKHRTIRNIWVGSVERLPFPDNSFTLVTANMVVEHLADPFSAFAEICRVLVPGGVFLFHTPNVNVFPTIVNKHLPDGLKKLVAKVLEAREPEDVYPTYYRCNSERNIVENAERSGLAVKQIRYIPTSATFARILPISVLELLWIRATMRESLARYRSNIVGFLYKTS